LIKRIPGFSGKMFWPLEIYCIYKNAWMFGALLFLNTVAIF